MGLPKANQNLQAALDSLTQRYREACLDPKPTYKVDGQSVGYAEYLKLLADAIARTQQMLTVGVIVDVSSPVTGA
jgi:hypothetical protein